MTQQRPVPVAVPDSGREILFYLLTAVCCGSGVWLWLKLCS